jgi:hypothetical protein
LKEKFKWAHLSAVRNRYDHALGHPAHKRTISRVCHHHTMCGRRQRRPHSLSPPPCTAFACSRVPGRSPHSSSCRNAASHRLSQPSSLKLPMSTSSSTMCCATARGARRRPEPPHETLHRRFPPPRDIDHRHSSSFGQANEPMSTARA